jgi:hypothetical protein
MGHSSLASVQSEKLRIKNSDVFSIEPEGYSKNTLTESFR